MTFLPVVERELRIAARKRSTPWSRVIAALLALIIGAGFLYMSLATGAAAVRFGSGLFATLTWLTFAAALTAGLFFTADSLSEEKREGTLGFLFLTDLRGYDVVGGKLLATSLRGFYALLAVFPIMSITLLMGGVTGAEFSKSALALVNALFVSLTAGLLASSFCRDSQRAMAATLLLIILLCALGPIADSVFAAARKTSFRPVLSLLSPVYVFVIAGAWGKTPFWQGLLASHAVAWGAFAVACCVTPRTWQDGPGRSAALSGTRLYAWKYGGTRSRAAKRARLIARHPVLWLALRERWQSIAVWVLAAAVVICFAFMAWALPQMMWAIPNQFLSAIVLLLYLWTSSHSCRFFIDAKRSGLMELLLVTPLDSKNIVSGQWQALLRLFGFPLIILLLVQFAIGLLAQQTMMGFVGAVSGANGLSFVWYLLNALLGILATSGNLAALMWFGMWMGLISKNGSLATLRTMLFVQVLPWFLITFASTVLAGLLMFRRSMAGSSSFPILTFPLVLAALTLGKDAAFIYWSRRRLYCDFRKEAVRALNSQVPGALARQAGAVSSLPAIPAPN